MKASFLLGSVLHSGERQFKLGISLRGNLSWEYHIDLSCISEIYALEITEMQTHADMSTVIGASPVESKLEYMELGMERGFSIGSAANLCKNQPVLGTPSIKKMSFLDVIPFGSLQNYGISSISTSGWSGRAYA